MVSSVAIDNRAEPAGTADALREERAAIVVVSSAVNQNAKAANRDALFAKVLASSAPFAAGDAEPAE